MYLTRIAGIEPGSAETAKTSRDMMYLTRIAGIEPLTFPGFGLEIDGCILPA